MPSQDAPRLQQARQLVRDKGLSRRDLTLLREILAEGAADLVPLVEVGPGPESGPDGLAPLRREFGLFLAFLQHFSPRRLGEAREAMGHVLQHALARLRNLAREAHQSLLEEYAEPAWVVRLLDLIASLRAMSLAHAQEAPPELQEHWMGFLVEHQEAIREILAGIQTQEGGPIRVARLNDRLKTLNRTIQSGQGRLSDAIRRFVDALEEALPVDTQERVAPLLLLEHVVENLRLSLVRPLDRGIHWPAVEQVRGSLQWLWHHLGWRLPRIEEEVLHRALTPEARKALNALRRQSPAAFRIVARALTSHLAVLDLVERAESLLAASVEERFATVPSFLVVEAELSRLAEGPYHPEVADRLAETPEEAARLRAYLRQAVLSLRQDQSTVRGLLQQALANPDGDALPQALENLRLLLVSHQKQIMGDLAGLFSPELRERLFPGSPSAMEEGDRLRQRLQRLWEGLQPVQEQVRVHLELQDWARLALALAQAHQQLLAFRRGPEFALLRSHDREEAERLITQVGRLLENPPDVPRALREALDLLTEFMRFLELFLLRINARVPLIRHDLEIAREALRLAGQLRTEPAGAEHTRLAHKLIQTAKRIGVRDPQALTLLKRWVRAERSTKDTALPLEQLGRHLERLAVRLEAALV